MNEKILIIDDEPEILQILETALTAEGFQVKKASCGAEAIALCESEPVALAITDLKMPGMNGLDVITRLKAGDPDLEVIVLTGFATLDNAIAALHEHRAFHFLKKPLEDLEMFFQTIQHALEKRALRLQNRALLAELRQHQEHLEELVQERTAALEQEILERMQVEQTLQRYQEHLQELVEDRTAKLQDEIAERKRAEAQITASLQEKDVLLKEIHHRVKNNLQVIIALIKMRARATQDAGTRQFLTELEGQAHTMALVYEQLYQSANLAQVSMAPYLRQLTANVLETYGQREAIQCQLDAAVCLDVAQAMPCGLIVNELFSNMLKHAFPPGFQGQPTVRITLRQDGATYQLTVSDNGVGLPPGGDWRAGQTMGLRLVQLWATHQLGGTMAVTGDTGTTFTITFEVNDE